MNNPIDKLAYICVKDGQVLVSRSRGKDTWYLPGGKREGAETDQEALTREVKEELSVDLVQSTIKHFGTFTAQAHGKPSGTIVRMTCYTAEYTGQLAASAEIEQLEFFSYSRKADTSTVDHLIFDDLHSKGLLS